MVKMVIIYKFEYLLACNIAASTITITIHITIAIADETEHPFEQY